MFNFKLFLAPSHPQIGQDLSRVGYTHITIYAWFYVDSEKNRLHRDSEPWGGVGAPQKQNLRGIVLQGRNPQE